MTKRFAVPYAADAADFARIGPTEQRAGRWTAAAPFPLVVIDPVGGEPLRFNNNFYPEAPEAEEGAAPLERLRGRLQRMCRPWDRASSAFIDAYLAFLQGRIADDEALRAKAVSFEGLFAPGDWLFSAPRPLPRAHVVPEWMTNEDAPADALPVDFAFWLGDRMSVALSAGAALNPMRAAARAERFARNGIRAVSFDLRVLAAPDTFFEDLLGGHVVRFWADEPLPCGPFPPEVPRL